MQAHSKASPGLAYFSSLQQVLALLTLVRREIWALEVVVVALISSPYPRSSLDIGKHLISSRNLLRLTSELCQALMQVIQRRAVMA